MIRSIHSSIVYCCIRFARYLYAYEDLTRKLGKFSTVSNYFASRTNADQCTRRNAIIRRSKIDEDTFKQPCVPNQVQVMTMSTSDKCTIRASACFYRSHLDE
jgi:hypothetical protein